MVASVLSNPKFGSSLTPMCVEFRVWHTSAELRRGRPMAIISARPAAMFEFHRKAGR
jgi:hypothetical protein